MKKVILLILIILSFSSVCFAQTSPSSTTNVLQTPSKKTVGIFLETPSALVINKTTKDFMMRKANRIFPSEKFNILPLAITSNAINSYRPANRTANVYLAQPLDRLDIQAMAKNLNCDYAFYITINKGLPSMSADLNSATYKTSVTCEFRILNVQNENYVIHKQITQESSSDTVKNGIPTFDNPYSDALERALMNLDIDAHNL